MTKAVDGGETDGVSAIRSNGFDPEAVKGFVGRIENLEAEKVLLSDKFKEETIDPLNEDIKIVVEQAEAAGIPKKELKKVLKSRSLARKIEQTREKLGAYEQSNYDNLMLALGGLKDLPLGQAAITRIAAE